MNFIETVFGKLQRHPKRIVFPEGSEERIIRAAGQFAERKLGIPILLGKRVEIEAVAKAENIKLTRIMVIDPETADDLPVFCERIEQLDRYRKMNLTDSKTIMINPNYFAAMMVQYGQADGIVGGASAYSSALLRPLLQLIKPLPGVKLISSALIMDVANPSLGENGVLFLADCGVVPDPNVEQLASIAVQTGNLCRQMTGIKPRVAMLSFSTKGSAKSPSTEKVIAATALAKQRIITERLEMEIDGELQIDTALDPALAQRKAPASMVAGKANVLIFPDLNSGNIGSKLVQMVTKVESYGQILLGLSKPAAELSRGAAVEDILGVAAIVGLQAIEYRKLYPVDTSAA